MDTKQSWCYIQWYRCVSILSGKYTLFNNTCFLLYRHNIQGSVLTVHRDLARTQCGEGGGEGGLTWDSLGEEDVTQAAAPVLLSHCCTFTACRSSATGPMGGRMRSNYVTAFKYRLSGSLTCFVMLSHFRFHINALVKDKQNCNARVEDKDVEFRKPVCMACPHYSPAINIH